jgi:hypothetical protein
MRSAFESGVLRARPLLHLLVQQRLGDVGEEGFVEQRGQPADLGAPGGGAEDQRALVDGLLEVLADRLAIDQREVLSLSCSTGVRPAGCRHRTRRCRPTGTRGRSS